MEREGERERERERERGRERGKCKNDIYFSNRLKNGHVLASLAG